MAATKEDFAMNPVSRRDVLGALGATAFSLALPLPAAAQPKGLQSWPLKTSRRTGIHDIAPAPDGGVWFSAQASGHLGYFDPAKGTTELISLPGTSSPHGVIQGPDKAAWLTDGGAQAIVRVSWPERAIKSYPLPEGTPYANLNTAAFDGEGDHWFTGQAGIVGVVRVKTGQVEVWDAPKGRGPYGICATPKGDIWYCSLAGSYIARIDRRTGASTVVEPPTKDNGARRVWSDSRGRIWVSEWVSGNLSMHDPAAKSWRTWKLPGDNPHNYAVYVDERDIVWMTEWTANAIFSFDPATEKFERYALPREGTRIRQILGRKGEVWFPESGTEHVTVIRTA
jgi:virginiamycin B lyase